MILTHSGRCNADLWDRRVTKVTRLRVWKCTGKLFHSFSSPQVSRQPRLGYFSKLLNSAGLPYDSEKNRCLRVPTRR
jgi:hypothetical protein